MKLLGTKIVLYQRNLRENSHLLDHQESVQAGNQKVQLAPVQVENLIPHPGDLMHLLGDLMSHPEEIVVKHQVLLGLLQVNRVMNLQVGLIPVEVQQLQCHQKLIEVQIHQLQLRQVLGPQWHQLLSPRQQFSHVETVVQKKSAKSQRAVNRQMCRIYMYSLISVFTLVLAENF